MRWIHKYTRWRPVLELLPGTTRNAGSQSNETRESCAERAPEVNGSPCDITEEQRPFLPPTPG